MGIEGKPLLLEKKRNQKAEQKEVNRSAKELNFSENKENIKPVEMMKMKTEQVSNIEVRKTRSISKVAETSKKGENIENQF